MKVYSIFTIVLKGFGYLEEYVDVKQLYTTRSYYQDSNDIYKDTGFRILKII